MKTVELIAPVNPDRTVTIPLPEGVAPGAVEVHVVVIVEDAALRNPQRDPLRFSGHNLTLIDPSFTFRREDLYGDDGR